MTGIDVVYDAVASGFRTAAAIADATGISLRSVSAYLTVLRKRGEIQLGGLARHPSSQAWLRHGRRQLRLGPRGRGGYGSNVYLIARP